MTNKKNIGTSLSFFVDSYKASNIAKAEPSINFHFNAIQRNLEKYDKLLSDNDPYSLKDYFVKALNFVSDDSNDLLTKSIDFGEAFKAAITFMKSEDKKLSSPSSSFLKKIIYHYLELASEMKDRRVNALAIEIGKIFSNK